LAGPPRTLRWTAVLLTAVAAWGCAAGGAGRVGGGAAADLADLTNPFLGIDYSQWLVGPVAGLATAAEIESYLSLRDAAAAASFIEEFWRRRDPDPQAPGNPLRELFDERAEEADRRFSEAGYRGRRTDRGTISIVYGAPRETRFDVPEYAEDPPIEVWVYGEGAPSGLDGRRPLPEYRFAKHGDLTTFHRGLRPRLEPRTRLPGEPPARF